MGFSGITLSQLCLFYKLFYSDVRFQILVQIFFTLTPLKMILEIVPLEHVLPHFRINSDFQTKALYYFSFFQ